MARPAGYEGKHRLQQGPHGKPPIAGKVDIVEGRDGNFQGRLEWIVPRCGWPGGVPFRAGLCIDYVGHHDSFPRLPRVEKSFLAGDQPTTPTWPMAVTVD